MDSGSDPADDVFGDGKGKMLCFCAIQSVVPCLRMHFFIDLYSVCFAIFVGLGA